MPAQNLEKQSAHVLKVLNMMPSIPSNNSHEELMPRSDDVDTSATPGPGLRDLKKREWISILILCFVNLINYMDRFTLAGILTDLQKYYNIGDDEGGLLQTSFVLSYMIFAPLFGYLGDRYSRKLIMACGVFLWSLTTFLGSYMDNFYVFLMFRAAVGIGEASYSTIAPTIISDLFIKDVRSKMLAIFYFAIPVGSGLGYIVGSETARAFGSWQWALRVTPVLGIIAVLLIVFVLKDPARGEVEGSSHLQAGALRDDIKALVKNGSFLLSSAGFTCVAFTAGALAWWGPKLVSLGFSQQGGGPVNFNDVSFKFGIVAMISGLIGVPLGSYLAQRLRPRYASIDPLICAAGLLISAPLVFLSLLMAGKSGAWCFTFIFLGEVTLNLTWSIVADILLCVLCFSLSLKFGIVTIMAGVTGLSLGYYLSKSLGQHWAKADPLICACGLFISAPLLVGATYMATINSIGCYILLFLGQVALNLNWAIVADILLYVVLPTRRSTAEGFQLLVSHALGDAGSPYLIGVVSEALKVTFADDSSTNSSLSSTVKMTDSARDFRSLQYALFITCFVEVLGGLFFLMNSLYIVRDKNRVEKAVKATLMEPSHIIASETEHSSLMS